MSERGRERGEEREGGSKYAVVFLELIKLWHELWRLLSSIASKFPARISIYSPPSALFSGFLRKANQYDILYKPVQAGSKGPREVMFYEGLFDPPEESLPRDLQRLKKLIPGYYGVCDITDRAGETCILFPKF